MAKRRILVLEAHDFHSKNEYGRDSGKMQSDAKELYQRLLVDNVEVDKNRWL